MGKAVGGIGGIRGGGRRGRGVGGRRVDGAGRKQIIHGTMSEYSCILCCGFGPLG